MICIINCGSTKTPEIERIVYEYADTKIVHMSEMDPLTDFAGCKGIIISGAPILITEKDPEPHVPLFDWIKTTSIPILGICFGHQMLGMTFGAEPHLQKEDRDWQTIELLTDCPLFDKLPSEIELMEDHCEAISIPPGFVHVATSDSCVNEAMMHSERPLFGIQFHPETSGNHGAVIFENFVHICDRHQQQN